MAKNVTLIGGNNSPYSAYDDLYRFEHNPGIQRITNPVVPVTTTPAPDAPDTPDVPTVAPFTFTMPSYASDGPSYEEQLEDAERIRAENERSALYTEYLDSAETAVDYVNQMIDDELAQAALYGEELSFTDEQKEARISNYFASIWGEGQQKRLETLIDEYGEPEGFEGFFLTRGVADTDKKEGSETEVSKSKGQTPATILADEEDALGGLATILGG